MKVELVVAIRGRARFLSHLESVDMLLAALRRAGVEVALSQGMKPKPVVSLALPRAVGVETDADICTVELVGDEHDLEALVARLDATLPAGVVVTGARPSPGTPRVQGVRYLIETEPAGDDLAGAAGRLLAAGEAIVERRSPKGTKAVDVRRFVRDVRPVEGGLEIVIAVGQDGTARPEEVVEALARLDGRPVDVRRIVRTAIDIAPTTVGAGSHGNP